MTHTKQLQAFLMEKLAKCELSEEQIDKLSDIAYPHDGTVESMTAAARRMTADFTAYTMKDAAPAPQKPKTMSEEEIINLAMMF